MPFVLIVEDCEEAVPALQIALEAFYDCSVLHSANGDLAFSLLSGSPELPLAVVTDLNLPGASGYELIERIRQELRWTQVPIVVVTAESGFQARERVLRLGADAFFTKPYSPAGICHSLEKILHAKTQFPSPDVPAGSSGSPERS